jgi:hypothetical protein
VADSPGPGPGSGCSGAPIVSLRSGLLLAVRLQHSGREEAAGLTPVSLGASTADGEGTTGDDSETGQVRAPKLP